MYSHNSLHFHIMLTIIKINYLCTFLSFYPLCWILYFRKQRQCHYCVLWHSIFIELNNWYLVTDSQINTEYHRWIALKYSYSNLYFDVGICSQRAELMIIWLLFKHMQSRVSTYFVRHRVLFHYLLDITSMECLPLTFPCVNFHPGNNWGWNPFLPHIGVKCHKLATVGSPKPSSGIKSLVFIIKSGSSLPHTFCFLIPFVS